MRIAQVILSAWFLSSSASTASPIFFRKCCSTSQLADYFDRINQQNQHKVNQTIIIKSSSWKSSWGKQHHHNGHLISIFVLILNYCHRCRHNPHHYLRHVGPVATFHNCVDWWCIGHKFTSITLKYAHITHTIHGTSVCNSNRIGMERTQSETPWKAQSSTQKSCMAAWPSNSSAHLWSAVLSCKVGNWKSSGQLGDSNKSLLCQHRKSWTALGGSPRPQSIIWTDVHDPVYMIPATSWDALWERSNCITLWSKPASIVRTIYIVFTKTFS